MIIFHSVYVRPPRCLLQRNSSNQSFSFKSLHFLPGRRFPFHSSELSDDVMLTEFPQLQTGLLTSALPLAATHSCLKKKKRKKAANLSHLSFGEWKRHAQMTATSHRLWSYLRTHDWAAGKDRVGFAVFTDRSGDVVKIKAYCAKAQPLCLT